MPKDWQIEVEKLSNVQKLVHLAMRMDPIDQQELAAELLKARRRAYEDELNIQAAKVGCSKRRARLRNNASLSELSQMSRRDAESIVATYNYDLAAAIKKIGQEHPRANRNTYAKYLREWHNRRAEWKSAQIAAYTDRSARAQAFMDFYRFNLVQGYASLYPRDAVCPVCQGWINRGDVDIEEARLHPPPYHLNCPHYWRTRVEKLAQVDCAELWMGE